MERMQSTHSTQQQGWDHASLFTGDTAQKPGFFLLIPISPSLLLSPQGTAGAQTSL